MFEALIFIIFGWPGVLAGLALAAWGVYRRSCLWVLAGALLTLPITWYIAIGGHFYIVLLMPLFVASACLFLRWKQRRALALTPLFWAVGMVSSLSFLTFAPYAAWGQAFCSEFVPISALRFLMSTTNATFVLIYPVLMILVWRQHKRRERIFWMTAFGAWTFQQGVQSLCGYGVHLSTGLMRGVSALILLDVLAFSFWLGWRWRRDPQDVRADGVSILLTALILAMMTFVSVVALLATFE